MCNSDKTIKGVDLDRKEEVRGSIGGQRCHGDARFMAF